MILLSWSFAVERSASGLVGSLMRCVAPAVRLVLSTFLTSSLACGPNRPGTQGAIRLGKTIFPSLHDIPTENIVILTTIPGYDDNVEILENTWDIMKSSISFMAFALKHGMSLVV